MPATNAEKLAAIQQALDAKFGEGQILVERIEGQRGFSNTHHVLTGPLIARAYAGYRHRKYRLNEEPDCCSLDLNLRDRPDLAPLVAALAAGADGVTRVVNAPHLADKESDRIATAVAAVTAVGGDARPAPDGFVVTGRTLRGGPVAVAGDHRIALGFGVLGLAVPGITLGGVEAVAKSYPGFPAVLAAVAGGAGPAAGPVDVAPPSSDRGTRR